MGGTVKTQHDTKRKKKSQEEKRKKTNRKKPVDQKRKKTNHKKTVDQKRKKRQIVDSKQKHKEKRHDSTQVKSDSKKTRNKKETIKNTPVQKTFKATINVLTYVFMISIIIVSIIFSFSGEKDKAIFGYRFYTVLTNSMVPDKKEPQKNSFYAQDIIIVKQENYNDIKKGDVVTYRLGDQGAVLTHRVIDKMDTVGDKEGEYLITQGDANPSADPPVTSDRLIGKVVFVIPKVGLVITFVKDSIWLCALFAISLFGFLYVVKNYYI